MHFSRRQRQHRLTHVEKRAQQRGIPVKQLHLIEIHGDCYHVPGGALVFFLGYRAVARAFERFGLRLHHLVNRAIVVGADGYRRTTYACSRPRRTWRPA